MWISVISLHYQDTMGYHYISPLICSNLGIIETVSVELGTRFPLTISIIIVPEQLCNCMSTIMQLSRPGNISWPLIGQLSVNLSPHWLIRKSPFLLRYTNANGFNMIFCGECVRNSFASTNIIYQAYIFWSCQTVFFYFFYNCHKYISN